MRCAADVGGMSERDARMPRDPALTVQAWGKRCEDLSSSNHFSLFVWVNDTGKSWKQPQLIGFWPITLVANHIFVSNECFLFGLFFLEARRGLWDFGL